MPAHIAGYFSHSRVSPRSPQSFVGTHHVENTLHETLSSDCCGGFEPLTECPPTSCSVVSLLASDDHLRRSIGCRDERHVHLLVGLQLFVTHQCLDSRVRQIHGVRCFRCIQELLCWTTEDCAHDEGPLLPMLLQPPPKIGGLS